MVRLKKYEEQEDFLPGRNSYADTDQYTSCMLMKEDRVAEKPRLKSAFNVQMGIEGQSIDGYSEPGCVGDTTCLITKDYGSNLAVCPAGLWQT